MAIHSPLDPTQRPPGINPGRHIRDGQRVLTEEEELQLAWQIASASAAESQVLGISPTYEEIAGVDYRLHPVGPEEFLFSDRFAGKYGSGLYPKWREELVRVLEPANQITEWVLTGCIGAGKSTVAALAMCYKLYRLGCLLDPCRYFQLMADSSIVFGVYSLFKYKSQEDNYRLLKTMIDGIPFFRDQFPRPKHYNPRAADDLQFPNRVSVITGSSELHALGLNLLCLLMDEVNFMKEQQRHGTNRNTSLNDVVSQAQNLYIASKRRLESRFHFRGSTPGLMILISSRNAESSWLERHMAEEGHKSNVHVSDFPLWEIKPKQNYCGKRFYVEVGDAIHPSRIIPNAMSAREGARVISPPVEHRDAFEADMDGALRDIGGVASIPTSALIKNRQVLRDAIDPKLFHPFTRQEFALSHLDDVPIKDYFLLDKLIKVVRSFPRPLLNPQASRFLHIDLAETQDSAGISMGHISAIEGTKPRITMDFMLRIKAPSAGMIDFSKIVDFVVFLSQHAGYPIRLVSFDRYQSTHARQILEKLGFESPAYSVDKTDEAYIVLLSTLNEGRLSVYEYEPFLTEVSRLVHDTVKRKVDHPPGGSKDVADGVAAVVAQLTKAMGDDPHFRATAGQTNPPEPVRSLQDRLEEAGTLANMTSLRKRGV